MMLHRPLVTTLLLVAATSLSACRATMQSSPAAAGAAAQTGQTPGGTPAGVPPVYAPYPARPEGPLDPRTDSYKIDAIDMTLFPGQAVEYKYRLVQGATMIYSWKADAPVRFDFHTVPDGKPISASETFMRGTVSQGQGTYRAPYPGLHGWYWKNAGKEPVTIVLNASGFFTEARMFSGDPVGEPMEVKDPPPPEY